MSIYFDIHPQLLRMWTHRDLVMFRREREEREEMERQEREEREALALEFKYRVRIFSIVH